jgi:phospholipase C
MQENRSFDSYFGTFPGADGIPMKNGVPTACLYDPGTPVCVRPFHDPKDLNFLGAYNGWGAALGDINGGRMDGFLSGPHAEPKGTPPELMGYHDAREIPNYWDYARRFVLQDPHVRAELRVEPAGPPVHRVGLVGQLLRPAQSDHVSDQLEPGD